VAEGVLPFVIGDDFLKVSNIIVMQQVVSAWFVEVFVRIWIWGILSVGGFGWLKNCGGRV